MKQINHIAIMFVGLAASILLSSAGYFDFRTTRLNENISDLSEKLPIKNNTAFKEGEVLTYKMHYGFIDAGVAILEVKPNLIKVKNRNVYHIVGTGYTTGTTDWFFKVRDRYETYMDKDALVPWLFLRQVDEGGYKFSQNYSFNHYTKKVDIGNDKKFDVPFGVQDMVSAFYAGRNLDLSGAKTGDIYTVECFVDKELWPLKIRFVGRETISTELGKIKCLKFSPIVQKGRVFKKEEDLTVWISDDKNHIPMRVKADVLVGSIKMDITSAKNLANPLARAL
jgi:hypothetical protein